MASVFLLGTPPRAARDQGISLAQRHGKRAAAQDRNVTTRYTIAKLTISARDTVNVCMAAERPAYGERSSLDRSMVNRGVVSNFAGVPARGPASSPRAYFFLAGRFFTEIAEMTEKLHAEKDSKTAEIKAPSWLSRVGKLMFRRVAKQLNAPETALSDTQTDLICDYVEARLRIASLADMLGADVAEASMFNVDKARIIALSRQIDSTTALSHKIADKLGLTSGD
jgi:hypothetical protein